MAGSFFPPGLPGTKTVRDAVPRRVLLQTPDKTHLIPGGIIIEGKSSRDLGNVGDFDVLRAGLILGKLTSSDRYAPAVICPLNTAYSSSGSLNVQLDVGVDCAKEIVRRVGSSGSLKLAGPPTAGGVVAVQAVTFSAVDTTTGIVTITAVAADAIVGSFVQGADGSETILGVIPDGTGIPVTDQDDNDVDVFSQLLRGGFVDADQLIPFTGLDASLQTFIKDQLNAKGDFSFDEDYHP